MNLSLHSTHEDYLPHLRASEEGKILAELGPYDVLLGRGTGPNENHGNVRFRELLKVTMIKYGQGTSGQSAGGIPAALKLRISKEVLRLISVMDGRFVRKLSKEDSRAICATAFPELDRRLAEKTQLYVVVSDALAMEKTKQSMRFQINKEEVAKPIKNKQAIDKHLRDVLNRKMSTGEKQLDLVDSPYVQCSNASARIVNASLDLMSNKLQPSLTRPINENPLAQTSKTLMSSPQIKRTSHIADRIFNSLNARSKLPKESTSMNTGVGLATQSLLGGSVGDLIQWSNCAKHEENSIRDLAVVHEMLALAHPRRGSQVGSALSVGSEKTESHGDALAMCGLGSSQILDFPVHEKQLQRFDNGSALAAARTVLAQRKRQKMLQDALLLLPTTITGTNVGAMKESTPAGNTVPSSLMAKTTALLKLQSAGLQQAGVGATTAGLVGHWPVNGALFHPES